MKTLQWGWVVLVGLSLGLALFVVLGSKQPEHKPEPPPLEASEKASQCFEGFKTRIPVKTAAICTAVTTSNLPPETRARAFTYLAAALLRQAQSKEADSACKTALSLHRELRLDEQISDPRLMQCLSKARGKP